MRWFILIFALLIVSCQTKKEVVDKVSIKKNTTEYVETVKTINNKVIRQDPIVSNNKINLDYLDLYKKLFTKDNPLTTIDSATNTIIETYIDFDNTLNQRITSQPKDISTSDTSIIVNKTKQETTERDSTHFEKEVVKKPEVSVGFFSKVWLFIKHSIIWVLIIIIILIFLYINKKIGFLRKLF